MGGRRAPLFKIITSKYFTYSNTAKLKLFMKKSSGSRDDKPNISIFQSRGTGSVKDSNVIDEALAKFFFGCNIPFSVVESTFFRDFVSVLDPTYKPPSRHYLADSLVDRIYNKIREENKKQLDKTNSVLLLDGWKNSSNNTKNVTAVLHNVKTGTRIFLESFDITGKSEDAALLEEIVNSCVELAERLYNTKIYAVITDNASAMLSMGRKVDLWQSSCSSHSGNLLAIDLVDKDFAKEVNELLKIFKAPGPEKELVVRGGKRVKLAGETRWCSYRDVFQYTFEALPLMKQLVDEKVVVLSEKNLTLLQDDQFPIKLQRCVDLWDPICILINKCQKKSCNIADAVQYWLELNGEEDLQDFQDVIANRINKALWPAAFAANILHHMYQGVLLSDSQLESGREFIHEHLDEEGLNEFAAYIDREGMFPKILDKQLESPFAFWNMAQFKHPKLAELAEKLLNMLAATAEIERLFSNWAYVHSLLRNRLKNERSKKLVHIYYHLHGDQMTSKLQFPDV